MPNKLRGSVILHMTIVGVAVVINTIFLLELIREKRQLSDKLYWKLVILHFFMSYLSKMSENIKTKGVYLMINFLQNKVINVMLTTRYNLKTDRHYILLKASLVFVMTLLNSYLPFSKNFFMCLLLVLV